jgi:hypothetical protein
MKKSVQILLIILLIIVQSTNIRAQNLIPNGDFEEGPDSTSGEWLYGVDSTCNYVGTVLGPNFWTVVHPSPDRMIVGDIGTKPGCWDNDTAQSGKAYLVLGFNEACKAILLFPIQKDSLYQLSYYLSLESFSGTHFQPNRITFIFNNGCNNITSPYIITAKWQYFDTIFKATANATEIEIIGGILPDSSFYTGAKIDYVSLIKLSYVSIMDYSSMKKNINIYPNPTTGILHIDGDYGFEITIYNTLGQEVFHTSNINNNLTQLDLSDLLKGIYFIIIKTNKELIAEKFLLTN